jgi:hypothetical protein
MKMVGDSSENRLHKAACQSSEVTRQSDIAKAIAAGGGSTVVQKAIVTAEKAHYLRLASSAIANGVSNGAEFIQSAGWVGTGA